MTKNFIQVVVLAIIRKENKYLLTLRNDTKPDIHNKWQIAGGGLEFGELPEQCLHREVREELGTEVQVVHPYPFVDTEIRGNWQGIFISYLCNLKNENGEITINDEATEYGWFTLEDMYNLDLLPGCIELVEKVDKTLPIRKYIR